MGDVPFVHGIDNVLFCTACEISVVEAESFSAAVVIIAAVLPSKRWDCVERSLRSVSVLV